MRTKARFISSIAVLTIAVLFGTSAPANSAGGLSCSGCVGSGDIGDGAVRSRDITNNTITNSDTAYNLKTGLVDVNPASIAGGVVGSATFTLTGATTGDFVMMNPPGGLTDLLFTGSAVTAANTVTVYLYNPSITPLDDSVRSWRFFLFDRAG